MHITDLILYFNRSWLVVYYVLGNTTVFNMFIVQALQWPALKVHIPYFLFAHNLYLVPYAQFA